MNELHKYLFICICLCIWSGCTTRISETYINHYEKDVYYFSGTELTFFPDSFFLKSHWSCISGMTGVGKYSISNDLLTLTFEGNQSKIDHFLNNPHEKGSLEIDSKTSDDSIYLKIYVLSSQKSPLLFRTLNLIDSEGVARKFDTDLDGKIEMVIGKGKYEEIRLPSEIGEEEIGYSISENKDSQVVIPFAEHIPFVRDGTIEIYRIKKGGKYLEYRIGDYTECFKRN